jgi:8-oxo-dGTP diphosphatase/2-hydroxy-dATP diphosphatase
MEKKILTLSFILSDQRILLGMKKRGFGEGRWNGFGGKLEESEDVETAARREATEEIGVKIIKLEKRGELNFFYHHTGVVMNVHIFLISDYQGEIKENEEMKPEWFEVDKVPYDKMWPDDIYWLPKFLSGKKFQGDFQFADYNTIIEYNLTDLN